MHLVKHSAGVVTPNKNGTHFHLYAMIWISVVNAIQCLLFLSLLRSSTRLQSLLTVLFFQFEMQTLFDFKSTFAVHSFLLFGSCKPRHYHFTFEIQLCTYALNVYALMNVIFCEVSCQCWIQVHTKWNGIGRLFSPINYSAMAFFSPLFLVRVALFFLFVD